MDPSRREELLTKFDIVDKPGDRPGTRAVSVYGSLVGMLIARHGTEEPGFSKGEIGELREWFESGGGR